MVLLAWALAMIVPDLWRVVQPLGSFGFYANNDGLSYDVTGPFDDQTASPAWNAGIREGDRLDLSKLRCSTCPFTRRMTLLLVSIEPLTRVPFRIVTHSP